MSTKVRFLYNTEIKKFQNFVKKNWDKNHILSKKKKHFLFL